MFCVSDELGESVPIPTRTPPSSIARTAAIEHHAPVDHHGVDGSAGFAEDQLEQRVVQRDEVRPREVEQHEVGAIARREPSDEIAHAEDAGAALGRHAERFVGAEPSAVVEGVHA